MKRIRETRYMPPRTEVITCGVRCMEFAGSTGGTDNFARRQNNFLDEEDEEFEPFFPVYKNKLWEE